MISAYRIVDPWLAEDAFNGEGARASGGRWNSPGHAVVYTSSNAALCTLELLANIPSPRRLPEYAIIECLFPEALVEELDHSALPEDWASVPSPPVLQAIGNAWLISQRSAVLAVPSAVMPTSLNYLLNPEHPDFRSVEIGLPRPFRLDFRLLT